MYVSSAALAMANHRHAVSDGRHAFIPRIIVMGGRLIVGCRLSVVHRPSKVPFQVSAA